MENQSELIIELRSKLSSSENRVKELEAANAKLASLVSSCICHKTHKGAACVRDKPCMHCNKHCIIFSKDKASGNQAIDLGDEDVAEETKKTSPSPIDVEGFGNVPMSQGPTASVSSKRKRNKSLEVGSFYMKASKDINETLEKVEENFDSDLSDKNMLAEKMEKLKQGNSVENGKRKPKKRLSGYSFNSMNHHSQRLVALKIMYFGQRFYGFASEAQMEPTVESELFKALEKTRLVLGDKKDLQYSRCGRTDKGVSSVGQVVALLLRSKLKEHGGNTSEEFVDKRPEEEELDYVRILNGALPNDIRVMGWCPAPDNFSARFSCLSREYRYFFWRENLNILEMESSCKRLIGEHDFRNFCKMDAANVHNYKRRITSFDICHCNGSDELWFMRIKGSAFLWHQVRCMVAVLFLIGQGLESPDVVDALLDVKKTPRKPQYKMAPEIPLVLRSCEFEGLNFMCSSDSRRALQLHLEKECQTYKLQAAIFHQALLNLSTIQDDVSITSKTKKKVSSHVPLMSRPTEPSYNERRAKLLTYALSKKTLQE